MASVFISLRKNSKFECYCCIIHNMLINWIWGTWNKDNNISTFVKMKHLIFGNIKESMHEVSFWYWNFKILNKCSSNFCLLWYSHLFLFCSYLSLFSNLKLTAYIITIFTTIYFLYNENTFIISHTKTLKFFF